jgi:2-keto-4-pentenoate hydratase/2-oxohepta-3-ene-1,7-dioic acid hydratase in catechol pathway
MTPIHQNKENPQMKLAFYNDFQLGVIKDDQIVDASAALAGISYHSPQELINTLIVGWSEHGQRIEQAVAGKAGVALDSVRLRPPVPRPGQLVCLAGNYIEQGHPGRGQFNAFLKSPTSIIGKGDTSEFPPAEATVFHFEPELAIIIGKTASYISRDEAMDYVFGYTHFIDGSARGLPGGFFLGKSWHTFGPMGPALVTADEITDPNALGVRLWVNDDLRHDFSTNSMDRFIPELLEEVTKVLTLEPGDVVSTGTHHEALTPIQDGDTLRLEIAGLGPALTVNIRDPLKRTSWAA